MRILPVSQQITAELRKVESAKKTSHTEKSASARVDRGEFSSNAQRLSETKSNSDIVSAQIVAQPDIREDKVAEVRQKIADGFYDSPEFLDKLTDKLIKDLGIQS
jgi:flagellar biosynthesis anti-sigma factor FlgM